MRFDFILLAPNFCALICLAPQAGAQVFRGSPVLPVPANVRAAASAMPLAPVAVPPGYASSSANAVAQTNSMAALNDVRPLSIGDRLSYRIVEEEKPPVPLSIADSGELEVPLIGRVSATGRTCRELAGEIKRLLDRTYFYNCTVILGLDVVSTKSIGRVFFKGPVVSNAPMMLPSDQPLTVSRAILQAGGFGAFANERKVEIVRKGNGGKRIKVDVKEVLEKGRDDLDEVLQPDDLIIVGQRLINF